MFNEGAETRGFFKGESFIPELESSLDELDRNVCTIGRSIAKETLSRLEMRKSVVSLGQPCVQPGEVPFHPGRKIVSNRSRLRSFLACLFCLFKSQPADSPPLVCRDLAADGRGTVQGRLEIPKGVLIVVHVVLEGTSGDIAASLTFPIVEAAEEDDRSFRIMDRPGELLELEDEVAATQQKIRLRGRQVSCSGDLDCAPKNDLGAWQVGFKSQRGAVKTQEKRHLIANGLLDRLSDNSASASRIDLQRGLQLGELTRTEASRVYPVQLLPGTGDDARRSDLRLYPAIERRLDEFDGLEVQRGTDCEEVAHSETAAQASVLEEPICLVETTLHLSYAGGAQVRFERFLNGSCLRVADSNQQWLFELTHRRGG